MHAWGTSVCGCWQARQWRPALLLAQQTGAGELVGSVVQPAAEEAAGALTAEAAADTERLHKYRLRLQEVRARLGLGDCCWVSCLQSGLGAACVWHCGRNL